MPNVRQLFVRMKPALNKLNNIHCLETGLFSHEMRLAGTVDCIAEYDGELSVIDFKTSKRLKKKDDIRNYFMQGCAYAKMYEEMMGIAVNNIVILIGVDSAEFPQVMFGHPNDYIDELNEYIYNYHQRIA
jgi:ATP-dependent exoDNAse (exonuclease V) beta subunit